MDDEVVTGSGPEGDSGFDGMGALAAAGALGLGAAAIAIRTRRVTDSRETALPTA